MNRNIHATRALVALGIALAIAQTAYAQPGPAAPTNVTATAVSDTQIDISWTDAPDEDYYYIYRDGALWAGVSDGSTSVSDRTRSPNTTYSYYIRSWWSAEDLEGPASNTATATTKPVHAWSSSSFSLTGPSNGMTMTTYSFDVTTPASCNWGHSIQYQIQWDGVNSEMGSYGQTHFTHSWSSSGTYAIRGKSYCSGGLSNGDINTWISLMTVSIGGHVVNAPTTPTGTTSGNANTSYSYTAGNATDTLAHAISSYQFDWGDGTLSGWGAATQSHSWSSAGTYAVKAQAKCSAGLESAWSTTLNVSITAPHTLTSPTTPSGTANGSLNTSYSYSTGSSTCNQSHAVQYRFDWGDGSAQVLGSATQSHTWTTAATYSVKAQAQCSGGVTSSWSTALSVTISSHSLTLPSTPSGPLTACPNIASSYSTGSSTCNQSHAVQYRFDWGDGSAQVLGSATQSHTWTTAATRIVKAQAQCSAGVQSLWSNSISVVVAPDTTAPTVPGSLTATAISTSQINLSWTASTDSGGSGLAGYKIERSTNGSTFTQIATVSGAGTSYSSTGLVAGTRYYYQTRAYDLAGNNSAYTSIASDWT
ncbi:MAG: fibronectin type III domain-containing protein, partial [Planctomycetes bacterium]|nr:fibronectin type III domain-containing protein [Planctomycetota bacterium]